ncbi:hypothetical protein B0H13DRAFT_2106498 [Mycena leptocephala]|nr:hypothetical protein B0H13DRAFT_2106498 [Mycena leptocephala]
MLVDSPMAQSMFATPQYGTEYTAQDFNDIFNTELFSLPSSGASSSSPSTSSGSRESTPHLLTPPQAPPAAAFPDVGVNDGGSPTPSFFNFLDEDVKAFDPTLLNQAPYDFFGAFGSSMGLSSGGGGGASNLISSTMDSSSGLSFDSSMSMDSVSVGSAAEMSAMLGIDPSLVGSPASNTNSYGSDFESSSSNDSSSNDSTSPQAAASPEESTTIAPVKVGGHGKARKGTVVSGGIKKSSSSSSSAAAAVKENTSASTAFMPTTTFKPRGASKAHGDDDEDDDDLPADWRPPPEVFQKMSSKEKRQLRNKISARNFRVRRKEYISTLEDNIAERDRLLSAIRSELGSTQSENLALRQEIAALKRTLLDNRGPAPVLPPPAPLSLSPSLASSASSPSSSSSSSAATTKKEDLPLAHTLKDIGASSSARFWGGANMGMAGGYTSVHTARIPELLGASPWAASPFASANIETPASAPPPVAPQQQENLNPALNNAKVTDLVHRAGLGMGAGMGAPPTMNANANADTWGDANPFTVRSLDAYRMHLWGRMAAQYRHNKEQTASASPPPPSHSPSHSHNSPFSSGAASPFSNGTPTNNASSAFAPSPFFNASAKAHSPPHSPPFPLSGLAGGLRPKYFASPTMFGSSPSSASSSSSGGNKDDKTASSLAASLAGLSLSPKGGVLQQQHLRQKEAQQQREREQAREREREAMYAALASQTLLKRLGGAFWEAFSGAEHKDKSGAALASSSTGSSTASSSNVGRNWDAEKVRKVLEGKAVVRVVDVEPPSPRLANAAVQTPAVTPASPKASPKMEAKRCSSTKVAEVLEESMRSLSLGKK